MPTPAPHPFDQALDLQPQPGQGLWRGATSPAYGNMVGPFGGVTAATLLQAVLLDPQRQGEPLALTVNYAGPIADGPFDVQVTLARSNRSTQHWLVQMRQAEATVATATAVLATRRETWSAVETGFPPAPPASGLDRLPPLARARWTSAYDIRFVKGGLLSQAARPAGENADSVSLQWVRDEPPRALDFPALAALCDVFFPRLFVRRPAWVPIGTVSFTVYFHADGAALARIGQQHLLGHARAHQFSKGFFDQAAEMWGPDGELLAVTHQIVYYKE